METAAAERSSETATEPVSYRTPREASYHDVLASATAGKRLPTPVPKKDAVLILEEGGVLPAEVPARALLEEAGVLRAEVPSALLALLARGDTRRRLHARRTGV